MTKVEKKIVIVVIGILGYFIYAANNVLNEIDSAGGIKQVVIQAGKEIKDISETISND